MEPIVKVPMRTYKGKPLENYSKEELIQIFEKVWALYASTVEENWLSLHPVARPGATRLLNKIFGRGRRTF